jgi:hypothetical protein
MRALVQLIPLLAYGSIAYLIWSLAELSGCNAGESCLGYSVHFGIGMVAAATVLISGILAWIYVRRRIAVTASLPIALSILFLVVSVLVAYFSIAA